MKTITTNIYLFNELCEKAQRKAWEKSSLDFSDDRGQEFRDTLSAFENIFDVKVYHYEIGSFLYKPTFEFETLRKK